MQTYNRILAIIDPTAEHQKSVERAVELAGKNGATVTAFLTVYDLSYELTTMLSADERLLMRSSIIKEKEAWLQEYLAPYQDKVSQLSFKVVWHNRPFEAIIDIVNQDNFDTVVKATHEHHVLKSVLFTPTDWHLLRKCPVPVLLVKDHKWPDNGLVLAAVNAVHQDPSHDALSQKIVREAKNIAETLNAKLKLVTCYPGAPVNLVVEIPEFDADSYADSIKALYREALLNLAKQYHIEEEDCILKEGLADDMLPVLADDMDAELVVLGTVGRGGLSAALIGNTAEHILDALDCDVLAFKPDNYSN